MSILEALHILSPWFWFSVGIICLIIEIITPGIFYAATLSIAAFITGVVSFFITDKFILLLVFAVLAIVSIFLIKPFLQKAFRLDEDTTLSNVDSIIGKTGMVTQEITAIQKGLVKIDGEVWTAITSNNETLPVQTKIVVQKIEGVTLFVNKEEA